MSLPTAEVNFRASAFPIKIEGFRTDNGELVWSRVLDRPDLGTKNKLEVPPLKKLHGCRIGIRIKCADEEEWHEVVELEN